MTEPCSNVQHETADWYIQDGVQVGKFTKEYPIFIGGKVIITGQLNGEKWDTLCPKPAQKLAATPKKFRDCSDCNGNV